MQMTNIGQLYKKSKHRCECKQEHQTRYNISGIQQAFLYFVKGLYKLYDFYSLSMTELSKGDFKKLPIYQKPQH